jgi:hypothetical protein
MIKFTRTATENEIKERRRLTLVFLGYDKAKEQASQEPASPGRWKENDGPILDYLESIYEHPGMKAVERDELCDYNKNGGTELRAVLKKFGLADSRMCRPGGRGRPWEDWFVTEKGLEALRINGRIKSGINGNKF